MRVINFTNGLQAKAGGRRGIFRAESERESEREIEREINLCNLEFSEGGGVVKSTSMCSQ